MKIVVLLACLAVFAVLCIGLYSLMRGGDFALKYSNKLMRLRVALQAVAIVLIMLTVFLTRHS